MKTTSWSNVPGETTIEVNKENGIIYDAHSEKPLPDAAQQLPLRNGEGGEITLHWVSCGGYDPGCHTQRNGDPGWPPSGEDERTFEYAELTILWDGVGWHWQNPDLGPIVLKIDDQTGKVLHDHYQEKIDNEELEPEYD